MEEKLYELFKKELFEQNTFNKVSTKFNELGSMCEHALVKAMDEKMNLLEEELENLRKSKKGE